jgi:hypothetical protein
LLLCLDFLSGKLDGKGEKERNGREGEERGRGGEERIVRFFLLSFFSLSPRFRFLVASVGTTAK